MSRHCVARVADIPEGSMRSIQAGDKLICVANLKQHGFRAIDDVCTHENELLSEGDVSGNEVECPAHGSRFSFDTGQVTGLPAIIPTNVYQVEVKDGDLFIEL